MDNSVDNLQKVDLNEQILTVFQINQLAKSLLENNMPICWISGEISGVKNYSHVYFDLKDENAKISCVLFANRLQLLDFKLENGQKIEVRGKITVYPANGSYQINVERVRKVGLGALWEAFNRLREKLQKEGLFDLIHKKSLPVMPKAIGVVTSKEGAVIRDVITILKRRMPAIPIVIYHTLVQGSDAAMQITKAIKLANQRAEVDVLIVCRGGGSLEDLWCFNEEVVCREVFKSNIPIISAIGHESNTTMIDFVSDLKAPTPSAAAELVVNSRNDWLNLLHKYHYKLQANWDRILNDKLQQIDLYKAKIKLINPINQYASKKSQLEFNQLKLQSAIKHKLDHAKYRLNHAQYQLKAQGLDTASFKQHLEHLNKRLRFAFNQVYNNRLTTLEHYITAQKLQSSIKHKVVASQKILDSVIRQLNLVNPTNVLNRGYAIVMDHNSHIVMSDNEVVQDQQLQVVVAQGKLKVKVIKT